MTGKTKARIIALRIWVRRRDKRVMRLLLLTFLLCAAVVFARARNGSSDQSEAETIKSIRTDEKIFAMTVVVTGDEKRRISKRLRISAAISAYRRPISSRPTGRKKMPSSVQSCPKKAAHWDCISRTICAAKAAVRY